MVPKVLVTEAELRSMPAGRSLNSLLKGTGFLLDYSPGKLVNV
jgi:hypothetical protein